MSKKQKRKYHIEDVLSEEDFAALPQTWKRVYWTYDVEKHVFLGHNIVATANEEVVDVAYPTMDIILPESSGTTIEVLKRIAPRRIEWVISRQTERSDAWAMQTAKDRWWRSLPMLEQRRQMALSRQLEAEVHA